MALEPIISSMLIDFDDSTCSPQEKTYQKQVYSAIKLNMSDIQQYEVVDKFTTCTQCKVILTDKDKGHVYDFQQVQSNPNDFKKQDVEQLRANKLSKVLWICGFCNRVNLIPISQIRFAKNKTRVIERQKMNQKRDPILLVVFDVSGSMDQIIQDNSGKNQNWPHLQKIKQTKIYKKLVADEQKQLQQVIKSQNQGAGGYTKDSKHKYHDYLKKNKLLMGLTEYLIGKINPFKKTVNTAQQANKKINDFCNNDTNRNKKSQSTKNKTVGFMFFNSNVILTLDTQKNTRKILFKDSNDQTKHKVQGFQLQVVDFDSFQSLYKAGQKYGGQYNRKIENFQFQSIDVKSMSNNTQGQTALGPAIVAALGVVSMHGQGSSILVVTDGIGNKGIFDQTQPWDQGYKLLKMRLQKLKCFMTVLQFRKLAQKNKMKQQQSLTGLDRFCQRHNDSVVRKINVILNQNQKGKDALQDIQSKLKIGIDRQNSYFSNQVLIKCQHKNVNYSKFSQQLKGKLFNLKQSFHINPQFKQSQLKQKDYLHQFMTQIVIKYQNTETGQQSIFMSYIIQKFIKFTKMKQKDVKALDNQYTFMNIMNYLHSQQEQLSLDNMPLGLIRETFRKTLCLMPIAQKTMRFLSKNQVEGYSGSQVIQYLKKFQDQSQRQQQQNKQKIKQKNKEIKLKQKKMKMQQQKINSKSTEIEWKKQQISFKQSIIKDQMQLQDQDSEEQYISL